MTWYEEQEAEAAAAYAEAANAEAIAEYERLTYEMEMINEAIAIASILLDDLEYSPRQLTDKELETMNFISAAANKYVIADKEMANEVVDLYNRFNNYLEKQKTHDNN